MGLLEHVTQMKSQGKSEDQIIQELQQQGISPRAINDAVSQAQIKSAISDESNEEEYEAPTPENPEMAPPEPLPDTGVGNYGSQTQEIQPEFPQGEMYSPSSQNPYSQDYPQQDQYQQQGYDQQDQQTGYEDYSSGGYSDNVIEVSEQVFSEKIKKTQKQMDALNEFKAIAEAQIETISSRLKRMETIMDKLQIEILEKIGSYGTNLHNIEKEMGMMQDSFGKMIKAPTLHVSHPTPPTHTPTPRIHSLPPLKHHITHRAPVKRKTKKSSRKK